MVARHPLRLQTKLPNQYRTHIQKAHIPRQIKVIPMRQRLVIKVRSHVMPNAHHKGAEILKVTIERGWLFEELEFDHVAVVAVFF